ncbi:MAG TPA: NAD(P)-binding domain-containing protein [Kofleriaceae bacterium]|nr:NAD(P)-binding domain-containing protein [Kofleriaceae bacterium]
MSARGDTVGIVGAGAFGTGLAVALARSGRPVTVYTRTPSIANAIEATRRCPRLPDVDVPASVRVIGDVKELAASARYIVLAVASQDAPARLAELGAVIDGGHIVVHAIGSLAGTGDERVSAIIERATPALRIGVLAGPALPRDLGAGQFASMVIASGFDEVVRETRRLLNLPPFLRVYGSRDVVGVELASALAGAYTVALGIADGIKVGPGPRAVAITRAVAEASRLAETAGGQVRTMSGLAGLGNMLVRAGDPDDPDYQLGLALARQEKVEHARYTEGARAALAGVRLAQRKGVHMPLLTGVAAVLAGKASVRDAARLAADTVAEEE